MSAGRGVEELLPLVDAGRLDTYEELLAALAEDEVWMLLWHGRPGDFESQYGSVEVAGHGYAPCVTSERELTASGWPRDHEVVGGRDIAAALYPEHWGLWLNPHAPGGGLGIPWLDLRRIAGGLDRLPAGPLRISEPSVRADAFYALLVQRAQRTPVVRSLRRAWVRPAIGSAYLVIGLDVDDPGERTAGAVRAMMREAITAVPDGLAVGTVAMADASTRSPCGCAPTPARSTTAMPPHPLPRTPRARVRTATATPGLRTERPARPWPAVLHHPSLRSAWDAGTA